MNIIKRLLWLLLSGFVVVSGAIAAITIAGMAFDKYASEYRETRQKADPRYYKVPAPGEVTFSDISFIEITTNAGVHDKITNNTKQKISSMNINVSFMRKDVLLYRCNETILVDIDPDQTTRFQLICDKVDRNAVTPDVEPKLSVSWVYPGRKK